MTGSFYEANVTSFTTSLLIINIKIYILQLPFHVSDPSLAGHVFSTLPLAVKP